MSLWEGAGLGSHRDGGAASVDSAVLSLMGRCLASSLQICSPASTGASVCARPSVTAGGSMLLGRAARWVSLRAIPLLGEATGSRKSVDLRLRGLR